MRARVVVDRQFIRDRDELATWLASEVPEWLPQLREELEELRARLEEFPDVGAPFVLRGKLMRKILFRRSPYVAWYSRPNPSTVRLLRLFHGHARRPRERQPGRKRYS